jgi:hypothetical protein
MWDGVGICVHSQQCILDTHNRFAFHTTHVRTSRIREIFIFINYYFNKCHMKQTLYAIKASKGLREQRQPFLNHYPNEVYIGPIVESDTPLEAVVRD